MQQLTQFHFQNAQPRAPMQQISAFGSHTIAPERLRIDVWHLGLDDAQFDVNRLWHVLSHEEMLRADRFATGVLRRRFIVAHAQLRICLAAYIGLHPRDIIFANGEHGKPVCVTPKATPFFNLSHTENRCVIAVCQNQPIGVDLEAMRAIDFDILKQVCSDAEQHQINAASPDQALILFYRCWVRKEAFLKACGVGLSVGPATFTVSLDRDAETFLLEAPVSMADPSGWATCEFTIGADYIGAVTARTTGRPLSITHKNL